MKKVANRVHFAGSEDHVHLALKVIFGKSCDLKAHADGSVSIPFRRLLDSTVPFQYRIRHRSDYSRSLSVPHPASQISLVLFYEEFRSLILLHTGSSPFSIRHPFKISRYTTFNDSIFAERKNSGHRGPESHASEYPNFRSYFTYRKFDNIGKFFESPEYRRNEKRFGHLLRLDITKCFDSVYTHSIAWAIHGKASAKAALTDNPKGFQQTFADAFDVQVRSMNDNETHGILIGPEFSRLFAEVVLQRVDKDVEGHLTSKGIVQGRDYEILRYVDDYFIFIRDTSLKSDIIGALESCLRPYRFHLNKGKEEITETPFISAVSIASGRLRERLASLICLDVLEIHESGTYGFVDFQVTSHRMISVYKTVLRETDLNPGDLVGTCLSSIEICLESEYRKFRDAEEVRLSVADEMARTRCGFYNRRNLIRALLATVEFAFFVYGGSPKVNSAVKLARIVSFSRKAAIDSGCSTDEVGRLNDLIADEVGIQLARSPLSPEATVEGLYMLALLRELGLDYLIPHATLCEFLGIETFKGSLAIPDWFNVLIACDLIRFVEGIDDYADILIALRSWGLNRIKTLNRDGRRHAEETLLALNMLASKAVDSETKFQILRLYGAKSRAEANEFTLAYHRWFTNWDLGDLHDQLLLKKVQEVY